ncbi:metallopeptidase family protein [Sporichthya polymorpha]|uniref:metallopeptidase family protein n=1 Tax=Sporichthya polymorpha TaxID=35751 RepID=UPI00036238A0|nr:metallopeptidase family protein [Sporichthya polymorpha]
MRKRLLRRSGESRPAADSPGPDAGAAPPVRRTRRDRRGRGLRGPLAPPDSPLSITRAEAFNILVEDAVDRLEVRWRKELAGVDFAVAPVPGPEAISGVGVSPGGVPLSRLYPGGAGRRPHIVLYRRPIEARAKGRADLAILVQDLVTEQVADLLGLTPEQVDPDYGLD